MWCKTCRQDVPALSSADERSLYCPRCGEAVCVDLREMLDESGTADGTTGESSGASAIPADKLPWYDTWELDEQLRHIERVLYGGKLKQRESETADRQVTLRLDVAHATGPEWHVSTVRKAGKNQEPNANRGAGSAVLMWFSLGLGTCSLVCGGILVVWSLATGRHELWDIGLPLGLAGQITLLAGLVLQIDRLWHDNRTTAEKLDNVGQEIRELQTSGTLPASDFGSASKVFYSHLANGAGPRLLLNDLKSQLDLLAAKIADERAAGRPISSGQTDGNRRI